MPLARRELLHLGSATAVAAVIPSLASAQSYPARPVRIIVGFGPGGAADILARLIGQRLSEQLRTTATRSMPPSTIGPILISYGI